MAEDRPIFLVTGATSGIGRAAAERLAGEGRVLLVARDPQKGERVRDVIVRRNGPDAAQLLVADLARAEDVRRLAGEVHSRVGGLDALINNAGVFTRCRQMTEDGLEYQFSVNYVAQFRLAYWLMPLLLAQVPSRIINVASMEHHLGRIHFDDLQLARGYSGSRAYRQSKLAVVLFTRELARRLEGTAVSVHAVHPGVVYTPLLQRINALSRLVKPFLLTPQAGAESLVYLATAAGLETASGGYFHRTRRVQPGSRARDAETARRLWIATEVLTGLYWNRRCAEPDRSDSPAHPGA